MGASEVFTRARRPAAGIGRPSDEDARRGQALLSRGLYGCGACHTIPGVRSARGIVGPHLGGVRQRPFIAGQLPNRWDVLVSFVRNPAALVPATGMPNVGLGSGDAVAIAAYLYAMEPSDR